MHPYRQPLAAPLVLARYEIELLGERTQIGNRAHPEQGCRGSNTKNSGSGARERASLPLTPAVASTTRALCGAQQHPSFLGREQIDSLSCSSNMAGLDARACICTSHQHASAASPPASQQTNTTHTYTSLFLSTHTHTKLTRTPLNLWAGHWLQCPPTHRRWGEQLQQQERKQQQVVSRPRQA